MTNLFDLHDSTILVVDDRPENLRIIGEYLGYYGAELMFAHSGEDALTKAKLEPPQLILLDVMMPGMDGFEACRRLKSDPDLANIPVIFLTALKEEESKLSGFEAGGVDYLAKPISEPELLARVSTHLKLYQAQKELARAKELAEASSRAKSAFLANMSHELRTPLNAVLGFAQILDADPQLLDVQRRHIASIKSGGDFLLTLINDVLDLSKIEAGRFELFPETWATRHFFHELSAMFSVRAEQKAIHFNSRGMNELPYALHCDSKRLRQIAMNLLGNAIKFTDHGDVTLSTRYEHGLLTMEIEDSGVGIPENQLNAIFEPFRQTGDQEHKLQGTGLGLSIAHRLVTAMDGSIEVQSTEGKGSRFTVTVPAEAVSSHQDALQRSDRFTTVTGHRQTDGDTQLHIFVADNIAENRQILNELLSSRGFQVTEVMVDDNGITPLSDTSGPKAPDAMLLGLCHRDTNVTKLASTLRDQHRLQGAPLIAIGTGAFAEDRERALEHGFDAYLTKPVRLSELLEELGQLLPIEWQHEKSVDPAQAGHALSSPQAEELLSLIRAGNLTRVREFGTSLNSDGCCPLLADQIVKFADSFDIRAIKEIAEQHL